MAREGRRNVSTNRNLQQARDSYETRTSLKEKRKIEELEAIVAEEEEHLKEQDMEKEVEWIQDPGTATTRATQFVRTQAKAWRMKTMLAKAVSMQGEYINQAHQAIALISTEHTVKLDALDFKLSALVQEVGTLSKRMSVLISLLRNSICQDPFAAGGSSQRKLQVPVRENGPLSALPSLEIRLVQPTRMLPPKIMSFSSCNGFSVSVCNPCFEMFCL